MGGRGVRGVPTTQLCFRPTQMHPGAGVGRGGGCPGAREIGCRKQRDGQTRGPPGCRKAPASRGAHRDTDFWRRSQHERSGRGGQSRDIIHGFYHHVISLLHDVQA